MRWSSTRALAKVHHRHLRKESSFPNGMYHPWPCPLKVTRTSQILVKNNTFPNTLGSRGRGDSAELRVTDLNWNKATCQLHVAILRYDHLYRSCLCAAPQSFHTHLGLLAFTYTISLGKSSHISSTSLPPTIPSTLFRYHLQGHLPALTEAALPLDISASPRTTISDRFLCLVHADLSSLEFTVHL